MNPISKDIASYSTNLLTGSVVIYGLIFLAVVGLFIWRAKTSIQSAFGFVLLFALSLALPASLLVLNRQTNVGSKAVESVKTMALIVNKLPNNTFVVTFQTSQPVIAYLEYKDSTANDFIPVLPQYILEKKNSHSISVTAKTAKGGTAYLVISGEKYLPNGSPIELK